MKNKSQGNTEKNKVRNKIKNKLDIVSFEEYISGSRYKFFGKRLKICGVVGLIALIAQVICIVLLINELKTNFLNNRSYLFWLGFAIVSFIIISFSFLEKPIATIRELLDKINYKLKRNYTINRKRKRLSRLIFVASKMFYAVSLPLRLLLYIVSCLLYIENGLVIIFPSSLFLKLAYHFQKITNFIDLKHIMKHPGLFGFHFWSFVFGLFCLDAVKKNVYSEALKKFVEEEERKAYYNQEMMKYSLVIYLCIAAIILFSLVFYFKFYYTEKTFQAKDRYYEWYKYNENIMKIYEFILLVLIVVEYIRDSNGYLIVVLMIVQILPDLINRMSLLSSRHRENEYMYDYLGKLEYIQDAKKISVNDIFNNEYFSSKDTELYMLDSSLCFVDYMALHNIMDSSYSSSSEYVSQNMNSISRSILSSKTFRIPYVHQIIFKSPYAPIKLNGVIVKRVKAYGVSLYVYILESNDQREYIYNQSVSFDINIITNLIDNLSDEKKITNYYYILDDKLYKYSSSDATNTEVVCEIKDTTKLYNKLNNKYHNYISKIRAYSFRSDAEEIEEIRARFFELYDSFYEELKNIIDGKKEKGLKSSNPSNIFDNINKIIKNKEFKNGTCSIEKYADDYREINTHLSSLRFMLDNMKKLKNDELSDDEQEIYDRLTFLIDEHNYDRYKKTIYDELFNRAFSPDYIMKSKSLIIDLPADIKLDESGEAQK